MIRILSEQTELYKLYVLESLNTGALIMYEKQYRQASCRYDLYMGERTGVLDWEKGESVRIWNN